MHSFTASTRTSQTVLQLAVVNPDFDGDGSVNEADDCGGDADVVGVATVCGASKAVRRSVTIVVQYASHPHSQVYVISPAHVLIYIMSVAMQKASGLGLAVPCRRHMRL